MKKALDIADEALELRDEQRARFIIEACSGDNELRSEVECLLEHSGDITIAGKASAIDMPALPPISDRFRIREELSRGGMGIVFYAHDTQLDREVAVKVLQESFRENSDIIWRFLNEAKVCGRMQHPGTPPIYDFGTLKDGLPFIAMKLVRGDTLAEFLKRPRDEGTLSQLITTFKQICETIAYAHSIGIIHRDLKPDNVIVSQFGDVQVMDWGLAKVLTGDASDNETETDGAASRRSSPPPSSASGSGLTTQAGTVMGTPAYMPPEQVKGVSAPTIDVFQLGAILCEILTGSPPYRAESPLDAYAMALQGELDDAKQRLEDCQADRELVNIARKCLAAEPQQRFANASELSQRLTNYLNSIQSRLRDAELTAARTETRIAESRKRRRIVTGLSAVIAIALITILGGLSWVMKQRLDYAEEVAIQTRRLAEVERKNDTRRHQLENSFNDSLLEAVQLFERAKAASLTDIAAWNDARTAIARADYLLYNNPEIESLKPRLDQLKADFQTVETELKIALDTTGARDMTFENPDFVPWGDTRPKIDKLDRVVSDNGFHPDSHADEPIIIERIKALPPPIREQLIGAIDQYYITSDESHRETFTQILVESDSNNWRKRWRDSFTKGDATALQAMLSDPDANQQSARSLINLVRSVAPWTDANTQIDFLQRHHAQHAQDAWYNYLLADLLAGNHRLEEAIRYYHAFLLARPNHRSRIFLGYALIQLGNYSEAIPHIEEAVRERPDDPTYRNLLIHALTRAKRYEETVVACREANQSNPQNHFVHLALGSALMELGRFDEAIAEFNRVSHDDHTDYSWQATVLHSECLRRDGCYLQSVQVFEQIDLGERELLTGFLSDRMSQLAAVALQVANGEKADSAVTTEEPSTHWRRRAREWLQSCLEVRGFDPRSWSSDTGIAAMHRPDTLTELPDAERREWQELWSQADKITDRMTSVPESTWVPVTPSVISTRSGAELIPQTDGSFYVQGPQLARDVYTLTFYSHTISAIKLDLIPDERLTNGGSGRDVSGSFELGEFALDVANKDRPGRRSQITFSRCLTDHSHAVSPVEQCIDGNLQTAWRNDGEPGRLRSVIFVLEQPLVLKDGDHLRLHLQHGGIDGAGIGRFRVSVSKQPFATRLVLPTLTLGD